MKRYSLQVRSVLAALPSPEECASLERILSGYEWELHFAPTFPETQAALWASPVGVVISTGTFGDGNGWKAVVNELHRMPIPPQLIVADRLADETLWSELLNLGCYDLLMVPFEPMEVLRVVPMAWDFWKREVERAAACPKAPGTADSPAAWRGSGQKPGASVHDAGKTLERGTSDRWETGCGCRDRSEKDRGCCKQPDPGGRELLPGRGTGIR